MSASRLLNDSTLTFAEKMINLKSGQTRLKAGDIGVVKVDLTIAQDSTGPLAIKVFDEMGLKRVWDPKKIFLFLDHSYPAPDIKVANLHHMVREFVKKHNCNIYEGTISHQTIMENHVRPGMLVVGADSHTNQAGALGAFATGVGSTEMASIWSSGKIWLKIPDSIKVNVEGSFRKGVFSRDIIMKLIGQLKEDGGNYTSLEWSGTKLSIDDRACISNNSVECGAKNSFFPFDAVTDAYLKKMGRKPLLKVASGRKAEYKDEITIDLKKLEPQVTLPGHVDRVRLLSEALGKPIDQAFLGSTTNCRIEDLEVAAKILKGRKVKKSTRLVITPASIRTWMEAYKKGLVETFMKAGAVFTNSTCGACVGTHMGVLGKGEVCISSSPRNYTGRMGDLTSKVYLASPATVAASAIEGKIADPRRFL